MYSRVEGMGGNDGECRGQKHESINLWSQGPRPCSLPESQTFRKPLVTLPLRDEILLHRSSPTYCILQDFGDLLWRKISSDNSRGVSGWSGVYASAVKDLDPGSCP